MFPLADPLKQAMSRPLTSTITTYQADWPSSYRREAARLVRVFGSALDAVQHIGSTAVPGLSAKPEIDILAIVNSLVHMDSWTESLAAFGYRRGGDLSEGHLFYKRDVEGVRTHKIHVCLAGHTKIDEMLSFRDYLRRYDDARMKYQVLKLELEKNNVHGIGEYLRGKEPFIRGVLERLDRE